MSTRPTPGAGDDAAELWELLATLVAFDSVNPSLVPGGAGEQQIARFVAGWLTTAGLDVRMEETAPGRPSVIARRRGTGGGRTLLLLAHTDTVGVAGSLVRVDPPDNTGWPHPPSAVIDAPHHSTAVVNVTPATAYFAGPVMPPRSMTCSL